MKKTTKFLLEELMQAKEEIKRLKSELGKSAFSEMQAAAEAVNRVNQLAKHLKCKPSEVVERAKGHAETIGKLEQLTDLPFQDVVDYVGGLKSTKIESVTKVTEESILAIVNELAEKDHRFSVGECREVALVALSQYLGANIEPQAQKVYTVENVEDAPRGFYAMYNKDGKYVCMLSNREHMRRLHDGRKAVYICPLPPEQLPE